MKILYISTVCSSKQYDKYYNVYKDKMRPSIQNFHYSIITGLANTDDVVALSGYQIPYSTKKMFFGIKCEKENNVNFVYPFIINCHFFRQFFTILFFIFYILFWIVKNIFKEKCIIIDSSFVTVSPIVVFLANLLSIHISGIVADVYDYMSINIKEEEKVSFLKRIVSRIIGYCWKCYDSFIFLTLKMNELLNKENKPYIVMEGIYNNIDIKDKKNSKTSKKIIMYSGSLNSKYGIDKLIEAFNTIKNPNIQLHLYGHTNMKNYILKAVKEDKRISYFGAVSIEEIRKREKEAYILVNPRPTEDEYTKYSFPSKTLEYMATGNIFITTKLDGIPSEYDEYVNYFEDESIDGIAKDLVKLLDDKNKNSLLKKASKAKEFILEKKNNIVQTKKISDFIHKLLDKRSNPDYLTFLEKISLIIITITSILPNFSHRYIFGMAMILWFLSIVPTLMRSKYELFRENMILFVSTFIMFQVMFINYLFDRYNLFFVYMFTNIRIISIIFIGLFYVYNKENRKSISKSFYIIVILTMCYACLKTGIYNIIYYNVSRIISTGIDKSKFHFVDIVGLGSYYYIYGLVYPIFIFMVYTINKIKKKQYDFNFYVILISLLIALFCIIKAEFMYSYILLIIAIIMYLFKINSIKRFIIGFFGLILLIVIIRIPLANTLESCAKHINKPNIEMRLNDIAGLLRGNIDKTVDVKARLENYNTSIDTFVENPIIGVGYNDGDTRIGLHSTFLDVFAKFGIIGGVVFVIFIISLVVVCIIDSIIFSFLYIVVPIMLYYLEDKNENIMDC